MAMNFKINKEKCIRCGLCVKDCALDALALDENRNPYVQSENNCIKCQHCLTICPVGAISVFGKNPANSLPTKNSYNSDTIIDVIRDRRSTRQFQQTNVDKEAFDKLKDILNYVPTGGNQRALHFSMIDDIDVMNRVRNQIYEKFYECCEKNETFRQNFASFNPKTHNGEDKLFRGAPHIIVTSVAKNGLCKETDPTIALSYFEILANSLGIGTCWVHIVLWLLKQVPELQKIFSIPETHEVAGVIVFGKPAVKYSRTIQPEAYEINIVK